MGPSASDNLKIRLKGRSAGHFLFFRASRQLKLVDLQVSIVINNIFYVVSFHNLSLPWLAFCANDQSKYVIIGTLRAVCSLATVPSAAGAL